MNAFNGLFYNFFFWSFVFDEDFTFMEIRFLSMSGWTDSIKSLQA